MSLVSTKSDWCSKPAHFLFQLWLSTCKGHRKSMQKLHGRIVGSLQSLCSCIVMIWRWYFGVGGAFSVDPNRTNLADMSHEWSLAIKYVKPSQAMFVRPAQHVPTHSTANEKRSSMHWHGALGAEVLGQAAIHSPPEGGHMSPANGHAGCNKCCRVGYSWRP